MKKILFLTNVVRRLGVMQQTLTILQKQEQLDGVSNCLWISEDTKWDENWQKELHTTDLLLVKWMGTGLDTAFFKQCLQYIKKNKIPYYIDAAGSDIEEVSGGLTTETVSLIRQYNTFAGEENYLNLWKYLQQLLTGNKINVSAPNPIYWCGIYHPAAQKVYTDLEEYKQDFFKENRAVLGIFFYREEWIWKDLEYQKILVEAAEAQGFNVVCIFTNGMPDTKMGMPSIEEVVEKFFCPKGVMLVDVIINTMKFSFSGSGALTIENLKKWNIPILEAYTIMSSYAEWENNLEGLNPMEVSISVSLPEFDGVIHGLPIASKKILANGDVRYLPIKERIDSLIRKALKWANLRKKANQDKKIAIIFHNYPPRNSNIGSAVGLDSIESVRLLLQKLQITGYKISNIPSSSEEFIEQLTTNATNDIDLLTNKQITVAKKLMKQQYVQFFEKLTKTVQEQLERDWQKPPGEIMVDNDKFIIPGTLNGNLFITVQPPRGFGEDPAKIYHDPYCAPTHQYLAFYYWLRKIWQADAVIHVGTHGSLEWLPGKNAGLSSSCYPDIALGDLPNIYPYNITITGEGIQAKRRGAACLVDHLPAPQTQSGVYEELEELEKILEEYLHFSVTAPENLAHLEDLVLTKVAEANLEQEVIYDCKQPFKEYIANLHNYITDLKNMSVHNGLHILGEMPKEEQLIDYLYLLTHLENGNIPSMTDTLASMYKLTYSDLITNSSNFYQPLKITYNKLAEQIDWQCKQIILILAESNFRQSAWEKIKQFTWLKSTSKEIQQNLQQICNYICENIYPALVLTKQETDNILRALQGEYIEPGLSGSPSSGGADLLPTGRNFFGVDPRTLPTCAAWDIGKELAEQVIARFILEEGHYPENIGIVLWSGANMRSHGQCIAEFLYLLGIKPKYQKGSLRIKGLEVIPLSELKRPRIDVTARISGLFRDSLPAAMNLLDQAVLLAAAQDEDLELNFVRKHILNESKVLEDEGLSHEDAWRQAAFRVFGDQQGTYGAGIAALLEAKNWQNIDDIAKVYIRWGAHAYGSGVNGTFLPQQFSKRMGSLDITIKNEDNHEINMLSSDDYNAYHGGMIAAVRSIKGKKPRSYCGDSTNKQKVVLHSVQEEAKRVFRSESVNPKYIAGMMQHGYKGASDLANMLAHSFQWDATSKVMDDWMYEKYAEKYVFDTKVQNWLRKVNPWSLKRMTEVLLEAEQRDLWKAKVETKASLQKLYLEMEGELEDRADE